VCSCARKIHSQKLKVSTQIEWGKLGAVMGKAKGIDVKRELYNQRSAHTHSRNLAKGSPKYLAEFFACTFCRVKVKAEILLFELLLMSALR